VERKQAEQLWHHRVGVAKSRLVWGHVTAAGAVDCRRVGYQRRCLQETGQKQTAAAAATECPGS